MPWKNILIVKTFKRNLLIFCLIVMLPALLISSCGILPGRSSRDRALKEQEVLDRKAASDLNARKKAHYKSQPKNTSKMMKKSQKYINRANKRKELK